MHIKQATRSGGSTIARFFGFRWAYLFLAVFLLGVLLSLLFLGETRYGEGAPFWSPSFIIYAGWPGGIGETAAQRLNGFLGLDLHVPRRWNHSPIAWWQEPTNLASILVTVLLLVAVALLIIPSSGKAKNLPASRPILMRGRIVASVIHGLIAAALIGGVVESTEFNVLPLFENLGWLKSNPLHMYGNSRQYFYDAFKPTWGVWGLVSWLSVSIIISATATLSICVGIFWPAPADRYWQTERRTLIYTFAGLAMIAGASVACDSRPGTYAYSHHFLGGWFSVWIVGWWVLTWAWLSRTALFFMLRRHDLALTDPDNPACFACGYNLRGSLMAKQTKCPECGTPISERLMSLDITNPI